MPSKGGLFSCPKRARYQNRYQNPPYLGPRPTEETKMARTAKAGLSYHQTKGYRISVGKKPDGGYRTWRSERAAVVHVEEVL